ncbi:prepilin-type N-terminal cleavage/methylation domain-containing protein [Candidatus Gracilibacteria bacterium]|nr:prepilin-type N-terminal cleavage/methylation domain-containing protein [Candidatus Gracilibacteria bacterium]
MKYSKSGFTLVEIIVSLLILSFVFISAFQILSYVGIAKIRLVEKSQIEKEAFFASERLIDLIKKGGTIDYEEYWNRQAIGTGLFIGGHFSVASGFGNEGTMYYCLSGDGSPMGMSGCLTGFNRTISSPSSSSYLGQQQRYGQYRLQYIDHNSDANDDDGDADGSGSFIGDDDDLFLGRGPDTFSFGDDAGELYLINASGDERTYFRWKYILDPDAPTGASCPISSGGKMLSGTGCLGTIQTLKLQGEDTNGDGSINEWIIHSDFVADTSRTLATSSDIDQYWQNIFSNRIHVSQAEFYLYPNQDLDYAWADSRPDLQVAPYLQLHITLEPSWRERKRLRGVIPSVDIATTIHLSQVDIF